MSEEGLLQQIGSLETSVNRRLDDMRDDLNRRLDSQDRELREIKKQTTATNGRVTVLEKARSRAEGMVSAFRWIPTVLAASLSTGLTILLMALTGNIH